MDKQNIFRSSNFHMDTGDVLHILIKDLTGVGITVGLNDSIGNAEDEIDVTPSGTIYTGVYNALYNWYAATDARDICAAGWHVPTEAEFNTLAAYLGGAGICGGKLKEAGLTYWDTPNLGADNSSDFNGRGVGERYDDGSFILLKQILGLWSSTEVDGYAKIMQLYNNDPGVTIDDASNPGTGDDPKNNAASIRPIKDSTTLTNGQTGTYTGNDGKVYRTICIGTQELVADNIDETKYRNGDLIPEVTDNSAWAALTTGAMCYYVYPLVDKDGNTYTTIDIGTQKWIIENYKTTKYADGSAISNLTVNATWQTDLSGSYCWYNNDSATYEATYGALYNYYAIINAKGLAYLERGGVQETGWRVPSATDFNTLMTYLGATCGGKLKEIGATWDAPNTGADNSSGFTARGCGYRVYDGSYVFVNIITYLATTSLDAGISLFHYDLIFNSSGYSTASASFNTGFTVRLVKDI